MDPSLGLPCPKQQAPSRCHMWGLKRHTPGPPQGPSPSEAEIVVTRGHRICDMALPHLVSNPPPGPPPATFGLRKASDILSLLLSIQTRVLSSFRSAPAAQRVHCAETSPPCRCPTHQSDASSTVFLPVAASALSLWGQDARSPQNLPFAPGGGSERRGVCAGHGTFSPPIPRQGLVGETSPRGAAPRPLASGGIAVSLEMWTLTSGPCPPASLAPTFVHGTESKGSCPESTHA